MTLLAAASTLVLFVGCPLTSFPSVVDATSPGSSTSTPASVSFREDAITPSLSATLTQSQNDDESVFSEEEEWRSALPSQLRDEKGAPIHRCVIDLSPSLSLQGVAPSRKRRCTVYLLGTSHISRTSCDDARLLMEHVRPDVLFVELCSQRTGLLLDKSVLPSSPAMPPTEEENNGASFLNRRGRKKRSARGVGEMSSGLLAKIQSDYAAKLNVTIGEEFREAFNSALGQQRSFWKSRKTQQYGGYSSSSTVHPRGERPCVVILGDRPLHLTLRRAWESLRLWGKTKLVLGLLWSSVRQPSDEELRAWMDSILDDRTGKSDALTKALDELGQTFPALRHAIIDERDEYMALKLAQTSRLLINRSPHSRGDDNDGIDHAAREENVIVAVVGAGHCPGIIDRLRMRKRQTEIENKARQIDAQAPEDENPLKNVNFSERTEEEILTTLVETKKLKIEASEEVRSLVTDVVQFNYESLISNGSTSTGV